ncbi:Acetyltransferase (GNAT) family [Rubrobacter radiotolerans]|uniref:Acetyltransferase (GNAT) family n=1 Tax=Rubrobacter radiotolerans TaxID=42256 RepID=A0A023X4V2_RUBRA|nr:GNAT family N-acetyltransferase [Rubrobacter radiotolerans]AHY47059.1 Acetyltransferase (GNAT) family [Rubrobacter radiotolerans]MDX5894465.1 GNAT family N-acetyltransferase [Rubrobacter radiotolerans]SMC06060.1 GCN5-related N-acetyltransferase [Rubrobacter radiotolerans DSM 5868]
MRLDRYRHFLEHDRDGCFVAADRESGEPVGIAVALRRESLWVLALLVVAGERRHSGVGRSLMSAALGYGEGCSSGMIASSQHPAAMRSYGRAGFLLRPTLTAKGRVRREGLRDPGDVRTGGERDLDLAARVDRHLRGAPHGPDLEFLLRHGSMLVCERGGSEGYAFAGPDGTLALLGATEADVAADLLRAHLAQKEETEVRWITAEQDWAVRVCLEVGLDLVPDGPICVRGEPGPLSPYLPSGPFL